MSHFSSRGLISVTLCLFFTSLFSQIPTFQKAYVGEFRDDCLWGIETIDGFLLAGRGRPLAGGVDGLLIKTDQNGKLIWSKNYGDTRPDWFTSAVVANDGGFVAYGMSGGTSSSDAGVWLVKVDSMGELIWQRTMGDTISSENPGVPMVHVPDGYVVSGTVNQPPLGIRGAFVTRVDNNGETSWSQFYATDTALGSNIVLQKLVVQYATDTMLFAISTAGKSAGFVAIDPFSGDIIRTTEYSHPDYRMDCTALQPTLDGNFVLNGLATPDDPSTPRLLWLLKVRADGQIIWAKAYPPNFNWSNLFITSHFSTASDGGFIICPSEVKQSGGTDYRMLMKLDNNGDVLWKKSYTSISSTPNWVLRCFETSDGGIAALGNFTFPSSYDDFFLMKTDADGEIAGCCSEKRDFLPPVDFPIEAVPASYHQEDYLTFKPINLTPTFAVNYSDTSICTVSPRPTLHDTLRFCPGESVTIGDSTYAQPATVSLLIPSATDDCDTLATYTLEHEAPDPNAALQLDCPADISVQANVPTIVHYNEPTAWSDCNCPDLTLVRASGPASGVAFPLGATSVCYQADDACANSRACCFTVTLAPAPPPPSDACDTKTIGCLQFELLQVNRDYAQNWAYHVRLTNSCADAVQYAYLQVPKGLQALAPINDIVYTTSNGHTFTARNPNFSPFYSVRYHFAAPTLASGQSETFRYVLPQQADVKYIHAAARLFSGAFVETHLNTFSCPVGTEPQPKPEAGERGDYGGGALRVYPNPVSAEEALFIEGLDMEGSDFVLRDLTGRLVLEASVTSGQVRVGEANLANGLYFFSILKNGLPVGSGKVVVVR
ncbi:MAG: HYR domain-containing protein [Saprospiraceae bacterium]|nr:HYR domain-containing protein [Saprospiraceae bacterium]